jgi:hypothetical protein
MNFKNKYFKYKRKYIELKYQMGGIHMGSMDENQDTEDIYLTLWKNKDSKEFDDNGDGKVSKAEYDKNIHKYFNLEVIGFENLDKDYFKRELDFIFRLSDKNTDNFISDDEVINLSNQIRSRSGLKIRSKDEIDSDEYTALKKIIGMEHICPIGSTDRIFKGIKDFSEQDTEKILKMFIRMRYLVEVKGKLEYITIDKRTKYEEEIFNLVCNNKDKCKFHNLQISDYESSTIDEYVKILKIIKKYEDPNIDGSLVVHCGAGHGRTGTIFMIYIWFNDYIKDNNNCKEETNKILDILNQLNSVLNNSIPILKKKISELKDDDHNKKVNEKYYNMIKDLDIISSRNLEVLLKKRKIYLHNFEESLFKNIEDLYNNEYLKGLNEKLEKNYTRKAAKELFEDDALFFIRLYRMIKAIKKFEERIKSNI